MGLPVWGFGVSGLSWGVRGCNVYLGMAGAIVWASF